MGEDKQLFVVLNPVAGLVNPSRTARAIQTWCEQHGWLCEIYETKDGGDLSGVIQSAIERGCRVIAAAGGDGTVAQVAAGMVFRPVPMVILPLGTGNLLARDLGIPFDLPRALNVIEKNGTSILMDVMEANGHYCVLNAGIGFSSLLIKNTNREAKRRYGFLAYIKTAVWAILGLQPYSFHVEVDGSSFKIRASEIYIANGGLVGLQLPLEDVHIHADDGRVDMFVIKARTLGDYLELFYYLIRRKPRRARKIFYTQGTKFIRIESEASLPVQADGEVIGETPVSIHVIPNAIKVLLPEKQEEALRSILRQIVGI